MLHIAHTLLHTAHTVLHIAHTLLHIAHTLLHTVHTTLHTTDCVADCTDFLLAKLGQVGDGSSAGGGALHGLQQGQQNTAALWPPAVHWLLH